MDYLGQLLEEKKKMALFPGFFDISERLIELEIARVHGQNLHSNPQAVPDVEPMEEMVTLQAKISIPVRQYPDFNFVGRILGPRGMTVRRLGQATGCRILVSGKGSMRDSDKVNACRGRPGWEHLDEDLHVLVECEDTRDRARAKMVDAISQVEKLLVPPQEPGVIDDLKRKQLTDLAILNGTYRPPMSQGLSRHMPHSLSTPTRPSVSSTSQFFPPVSGSSSFAAFDSPLPSPLKNPVSTSTQTNSPLTYFNNLVEQLSNLDHIPEGSFNFQS